MHIPFLTELMSLSPIKRQSILSLAFAVLITLVGFFATMLFSHLLGKDIMGVYYLFLAYFSIFNIIGDGGLGGAAVKRISEGHDENEFFTAYVFLRAILIVLSTAILIAVSPFFVDLAKYELVPFIIAALIAAFFSHGITYGVTGLGFVGVTNTANGISELARIIISVILVLLGFSVYGLIGGSIASMIVLGILCIKFLKFKPARFSKKHLASLISFSFWGLLIGSASMIMTYSDTIFIGYFMSNGDVGVYRTAVQFTSIAVFLVSAISSTLAPKISHWSANKEMEKIPPVISRSITYGLILAVPVAVGGFLLSERLIYFLYGSDFADGATVACIVFLFQIITVFLTFTGSALSNSNHAKETFYGTFAAIIINVALDIFLIPLIGINGAAIGSLVSIAVNTIIVVHFLKKYMTVRIEIKPVLHILASSAVMGLFVLAFRIFVPLNNVFITAVPVVVGAVIYFILLFKFDKGIRDEICEMVSALRGH